MTSSFSAPERVGDVDRVAGEHRVGLEQRLAVQQHLGDRGDAVKFEDHLVGLRIGTGEMGPKPPVLGVEVQRIALLPEPGVSQRAGSGARDGSGDGVVSGFGSGQLPALIERDRQGAVVEIAAPSPTPSWL